MHIGEPLSSPGKAQAPWHPLQCLGWGLLAADEAFGTTKGKLSSSELVTSVKLICTICSFVAFIICQLSGKIVWQISSKKQHFGLNIRANKAMNPNICSRSLFPSGVLCRGMGVTRSSAHPPLQKWLVTKHPWQSLCSFEELFKTKPYLKTAAFFGG